MSTSSVLKRPQEPKLPYPYNEEEVSFINARDKISLAGTLTLPNTLGPFPAVILLHGSSPLDRNSFLFGHNIFLVLSDYLTKNGIAVLRFDKRSAGKSTGNYDTSTIQDFASDALACVEYLKTRTEINVSQIGFIGHSEGGLTATLGASKSNDIAFVISLAGGGANGEEIVLLQDALLQRSDGADEETIKVGRKLREQTFAIVKEDENREIAAKKLGNVIDCYLNSLTSSQRKATETHYGTKEHQIKLLNSTWFRYWLTYDPTEVLKQLKIPILALNGELDLIVSSDQNLKKIALTLEKANHKDYTAKRIPKLNHIFQTCETGSLKEYFNIEETMSPLVLNMLSEWILEKTANKK